MKKLVGNGLLLLVSGALGVLVLELGIRWLRPQYDPYGAPRFERNADGVPLGRPGAERHTEAQREPLLLGGRVARDPSVDQRLFDKLTEQNALADEHPAHVARFDLLPERAVADLRLRTGQDLENQEPERESRQNQQKGRRAAPDRGRIARFGRRVAWRRRAGYTALELEPPAPIVVW